MTTAQMPREATLASKGRKTLSAYTSTFPTEWLMAPSQNTLQLSVLDSSLSMRSKNTDSRAHTPEMQVRRASPRSSIIVSQIAQSTAEQTPLPLKRKNYYAEYPSDWTLKDSDGLRSQMGTVTWASKPESNVNTEAYISQRMKPGHALPSDPSYWYAVRKEPTSTVIGTSFIVPGERRTDPWSQVFTQSALAGDNGASTNSQPYDLELGDLSRGAPQISSSYSYSFPYSHSAGDR